uniref:Uncharacterized protein n=1 Tax=Myotis myotis TaxID=51298 RepID=A0A7J7VYW1_MYOMY|nr:hypothetical protein mMyoMyo1_012218 [Myotis myotis]
MLGFSVARTHHLFQGCSCLTAGSSGSLHSAPPLTCPPFSQGMSVILLYLMALAESPSSCSVEGTDDSCSCWRHHLSVLPSHPDHIPPPSVLDASPITTLSYLAHTLFMFYSISCLCQNSRMYP